MHTLKKTNYHSSAECRVLKNLRPAKTLFSDAAQPSTSRASPPDLIPPLSNTMEPDPSLILMTSNDPATFLAPLLTHNCQIKNVLATLIIETTGVRRTLSPRTWCSASTLPTTPHPSQLVGGWVQKDSPRLIISQHCVVNFAIGPFYDTVVCDVS